MQNWTNKVAIITNCGDELGITIIEVLVKVGVTVIGLNKNKNTIKNVSKKLENKMSDKTAGKIVLYKCDITDSNQVETVIKNIKERFKSIDVLINNAYSYMDCLINTGSLDEFKQLIDVNIFAMVAVTRLVAATMIENVSKGHIININDLSSYQIPTDTKKSVFIATKAAVTSINDILRHEFRYLKADVKVTNIACGTVECYKEQENNETGLKPRDVAKLVKLILNTPDHLQVHEVLLDSIVE